uniref:(northern house mosquito) hypothetical protein n=1 Tax=Culex pipiens TaxID=7175 RepID=A0A8D8G8P6_CULPI
MRLVLSAVTLQLFSSLRIYVHIVSLSLLVFYNVRTQIQCFCNFMKKVESRSLSVTDDICRLEVFLCNIFIHANQRIDSSISRKTSEEFSEIFRKFIFVKISILI